MDNLIFCLNATIPIFLLMVAGYIFHKLNILSKEFLSNANSFVFKIALPVLVFNDLSTVDFISVWDSTYVLFCFCATLLSIGIAFMISLSFRGTHKSQRGEFSQVAYRSSSALLGIGFIQNIYGNSGMAPLMILGAVPLYNVMAVVLLSFLKPEVSTSSNSTTRYDSKLIKNTLLGILKNPIILGIILGFIWSLLKIPQPVIMTKSLKYIGSLATPLGLIAMGGGFEFKKCADSLVPALLASFLKLIAWCALFLPLAIKLGFTSDKLVSVLVMLGSPTTIACYVMAKNMGHEGTLTTSTVMITSLLSAFTLTAWLYVLKTLGLI